MHDIHADKQTLLNQVKWLEQSEQIDKEVSESRCPICGGKLELTIQRGGGDSIVTPFIGIVKCTHCDMFKKQIKRSSQESYHWKYDGSDEIRLKSDVWNSVKAYVKHT